jgi:UrcA family protein
MTLQQACLIVAAAAVGAGAAQAQSVKVLTDNTGTTTALVEGADLDLSQDVGAEAMWGRIQEASRDVCGESPTLADMSQTNAYRQCLQATETVAVNELGSTRVAAVSHLKSVQLYAAR